MELMSGSALGIYETRRILGDYVLVLEDFRGGVFPDEIGVTPTRLTYMQLSG